MANNKARTVWSSEEGDLRKKKELSAADFGLAQEGDRKGRPDRQRPDRQRPDGQQMVYLHRESKGRGGKGVTLVKGLALPVAELSALCKTLKQACGTGGTVKQGVIEIQGEQRQKIAGILKEMGYQVKIAGG